MSQLQSPDGPEFPLQPLQNTLLPVDDQGGIAEPLEEDPEVLDALLF
jgi:hypothetical protein